MVVELVLANTIVVPSGAARAAAAHGDDAVGAGPVVHHDLLAERRRELGWRRSAPCVSLPPPGGNGTIMVMVRLGKSWAAAGPRDERDQDREREAYACASLHLQIELADQRAPAGVLALDVGAVFLRRRRQRIAAVGGNPGAHVGRVDAGAKRAG